MTLADDMVGHRHELFKYAMRLCGSTHRAEDLVQETFLKALQHQSSFTGGHLDRWLSVILRNVFYSSYKKARREVSDIDGEYSHAIPIDPAPAVELKQALAILETLPRRYREVIRLISIEGHTYAETASIVGIPEGTVKSRHFRANQLMKKRSE